MSVKGLGLKPGIQKRSDCSMKLPSEKHLDEAMRSQHRVRDTLGESPKNTYSYFQSRTNVVVIGCRGCLVHHN